MAAPLKVRRGNLEQNLIFPSCCKEDCTELLENLLVAKVYLWSVTGNRKLMSLLICLANEAQIEQHVKIKWVG